MNAPKYFGETMCMNLQFKPSTHGHFKFDIKWVGLQRSWPQKAIHVLHLDLSRDAGISWREKKCEDKRIRNIWKPAS